MAFTTYCRGYDNFRHIPAKGLSYYVIVEDEAYSRRRLANIVSARNRYDWNILGNNHSREPQVDKHLIVGDTKARFPLETTLIPRTRNGVPEGYIHYYDGRFEPFWFEKNELPKGCLGYGVVFGRDFLEGPFECTPSYASPKAKYKMIMEPGGKKPKSLAFGPIPSNSQPRDRRKRFASGIKANGSAWFQTKEEADEFVKQYQGKVDQLRSVVETFDPMKTGELAFNCLVQKALDKHRDPHDNNYRDLGVI